MRWEWRLSELTDAHADDGYGRAALASAVLGGLVYLLFRRRLLGAVFAFWFACVLLAACGTSVAVLLSGRDRDETLSPFAVIGPAQPGVVASRRSAAPNVVRVATVGAIGSR